MDDARRITAFIEAVGPDLLIDTPAAREGFMNGVIFATMLIGTGLASADDPSAIGVSSQAYMMYKSTRSHKTELGLPSGWFANNNKGHEQLIEIVRQLRRAYLHVQNDTQVKHAFEEMLSGVIAGRQAEEAAKSPTWTLEELVGQTEPEQPKKTIGWWTNET